MSKLPSALRVNNVMHLRYVLLRVCTNNQRLLRNFVVCTEYISLTLINKTRARWRGGDYNVYQCNWCVLNKNAIRRLCGVGAVLVQAVLGTDKKKQRESADEWDGIKNDKRWHNTLRGYNHTTTITPSGTPNGLGTPGQNVQDELTLKSLQTPT